ncbi:MAG: hypothetical protein JO326_09755 [Acetobacteraceae bacterium]|nr:hypothetical protein [Acetobacteraceae bacterium]
MAATADRTDPALWEKVKARVTRGDKGGGKGQWSARKAQLAVQEYKKAGGGYKGRKSPDNHLTQWTREAWGTKSGKTSRATGERYLPKRAREHLSAEEYRRTTAKKRADTRHGQQFSKQPADVARKTARDRATGRGSRPRLDTLGRDELLARAARAGIANRHRMRKAELVDALRAR